LKVPVLEESLEIEILLFGAAKSARGGDRLAVSLPEGATVGELRKELARHIDRRLVAASAVADESSILRPDHVVLEGVTLALLPPVGGG